MNQELVKEKEGERDMEGETKEGTCVEDEEGARVGGGGGIMVIDGKRVREDKRAPQRRRDGERMR
jgi:hypothetical protein